MPKSFRFSPQTRFAIRLLAKQRGSDETAAVEAAVISALEQQALSRDWLALYADDESTRTLKCFTLEEYKVTDEEAAQRSFVFAHSRFFYSDEKRLHPRADLAHILWPKLGEYIRTWHEHLHEDYHHAARLMAADIRKAGKKSPPIEA